MRGCGAVMAILAFSICVLPCYADEGYLSSAPHEDVPQATLGRPVPLAATAAKPPSESPVIDVELRPATYLPATSTILPLLGLLGVASSGVGLWYRKHRK